MLAVDGRITTDDGVIHTETAQKWCTTTGGITSVFAGSVPHIQAAIRVLTQPASAGGPKHVRSVAEFMDVVLNCRPHVNASTDAEADAWEALVYDSQKRELYHVDSDGSCLQVDRRCAAIGSGSDIALGFLAAKMDAAGPDGKARAWTTTQASAQLRGAIRAASNRHSTVGPKANVIEVDLNTGRVRLRSKLR